MDSVKIKDLEVYANHGVFPEENVLGQKFLVSAICGIDTREAGMTDNLEASLHYGEICHTITRHMKENQTKLLEASAENLAERLLWEYPRMRTIRLEIKKPWAPIGLPLDTVSVEIERKKHIVYAAMGSNLGDKQDYIRFGTDRLEEHPSVHMLKVSDLIVTKPYGGVEQDDFVNGAMVFETTLYPHELLRLFKQIEAEAGRKKTVHWGPRTLDLDILFYDDQLIDTDDLVVPHPGIALRDFVLIPMAQLAPNFRHPLLKKRMRELLEELENNTPAGR